MRMQWRVTNSAVLTVLLLASSALADIRAEVDRLVRGTHLAGADVALSVRDAETGVELAAINASQPMIPASNMKLLTTGAALHILGSDFTFETRMVLDEQNRLIIVGSGDPGFGDPALLEIMSYEDKRGLDVEQFVAILADAVKKAGIESVSEVIVDDRIFDREFVHDGWPQDQLNRRYCAQVSGFNFHLNILHFFPEPVSGSRPNVGTFQPYVHWLEIGNSATSRRGADDSNTAWVARRLGSNSMRLYGNVKHAYRAPVPVTVHDMPAFYARLFADRLRERGVRVGAYGVMDHDEDPAEGTRIGPVVTTPMVTAIERCNRDSQNLYAEALLKRSGRELTNQPGSWTNGGAVLRHAMHERLGNPALATSVRFSDGSGLSRDNRISPQTMTAWLNTFHHDESVGEMFIDSLAVPGGRGTLRNRFRNTDLYSANVQAKSGYIRGVSALSGYVTMPDGRRRSFSVIINGTLDGRALRNARQLQEDIVTLIARSMSEAPAQLGSD